MSSDESSYATVPSDENPFSTRCVRPGAIEYVFPTGHDVDHLVELFRGNGARGEIVGPHGSGKSTLLAALLPRLATSGWSLQRCNLHDGERSLPSGWLRAAAIAPQALLVIDGYEQLSPRQRFRLLATCRRMDCGLLVTAHESVGLPRLWTTEVDAIRAAAVFSRLVPQPSALVSHSDLEDCLRRNPTDLRAALFELYDLYEQRRRESRKAK